MPILLGGTRATVVLAMHDETPGRDRHQVFQAGLDPVFGLDRVERDRLRDLLAGGMADEFADQRLIGRVGEMHA